MSCWRVAGVSEYLKKCCWQVYISVWYLISLLMSAQNCEAERSSLTLATRSERGNVTWRGKLKNTTPQYAPSFGRLCKRSERIPDFHSVLPIPRFAEAFNPQDCPYGGSSS